MVSRALSRLPCLRSLRATALSLIFTLALLPLAIFTRADPRVMVFAARGRALGRAVRTALPAQIGPPSAHRSAKVAAVGWAVRTAPALMITLARLVSGAGVVGAGVVGAGVVGAGPRSV